MDQSINNVDYFLSQLSNIQNGDYVVHKKYGVGRFLGIEKINYDKIINDCIVIEYAQNTKMILPIGHINQISKYRYIKNEEVGENINLDDINGKSWERKKNNASNKIQDIAYKIIEIIAKNSLITIDSVPIEKNREIIEKFYSEFKHILTKDQIIATKDIEKDFEKNKSINRLICGDVGFGKTEIAMRAVFLMSLLKKNDAISQILIICPTTFLVKQHYKNFSERFKNCNLNIKSLSRLTSTKDKDKILKGLKNGEINILITTHAGFSPKVEFKNLKLLIIDEEQSFGVEQKEKIKFKYPEIHILTLSATPIPRTLQNALYKIIDISILATPPKNRKPIKTEIIAFNSKKIFDGIEFEMKRNGKILFLVPRISDIYEIETFLSKINLKNFKYGILHGKIQKDEADQILLDFYDNKINLIIATTLLAQGVDIPDLNTIFIYRAEMFGISQLYQIRGRVGRGQTDALAYLIVEKNIQENQKIMDRLKILENANNLGDGFNIAMNDLDLRGAGNILGTEQSGEIKDIGFEMYQELLNDMIAEHQGDKIQKTKNPDIEMQKSLFIPDDYIKDYNSRFKIYKTISNLQSIEEIQEIANNVEEHFGDMPQEVVNLFDVADLKIFARENLISYVKVNDSKITIKFYPEKKLDIIKILNKIKQNPEYKIKNNEEIIIHADHQYDLKMIKIKILALLS